MAPHGRSHPQTINQYDKEGILYKHCLISITKRRGQFASLRAARERTLTNSMLCTILLTDGTDMRKN